MGYESLSQIGFIHEFNEVSNGAHPSKFCFVLGAGASKSSGIKTGQELVDIWEKELYERNRDELLRWKQELGITEENKYSFYSRYYEKRFQKRPRDGLNFLEKMMEHIHPGVGYVVLAYLLTNTKHNVVITTNFDHLVEDAVNYYAQTIPLIIGHESLAHYISKEITRPTIIKIHRDLLFDPQNTMKEVEKLHELWKGALEKIFEEYHPVFIGYAGNDNSLMNYLTENKKYFKSGVWRFLYWLLYKADAPEGKVRKFMEETEGYCINYNGFDELLCMIGKGAGYRMPTEEAFLKDAKLRYKKLSKDFENILINKSVGKNESIEASTEALEQAVQIITDDADSLAKSKLAISLHNRGQYREAWRLKKELVEEEPNNAGYHNSLGVTLHEMQAYKAAQAQKEEAVKLEPNNAEYRNSLGVTLHEMKEYGAAKKQKEKAIELDPNNARYHNSLSVTLHDAKEYGMARKEAEKAVELEPNNAKYRNSLGVTLHDAKEYEMARKEAEKAVELEPNNAKYRNSLGVTLHAMKEYKAAQAQKEETVKLEPNNAEYRNSLGVTLHEMKEYRAAKKQKEKAIELELNNARYHNSLSVTLHAMKEYEMARKEAEKAVELEPNNAKYRNSLGVTLHAMKEYKAAQAQKEKAVELEPNNAKYHNNLGITLHEMKEYGAAKKQKEKSVELEPNNAEYRNSLGVTLHAMKEYEMAQREAEKAVELEPANPVYHNNLKEILNKIKMENQSL